MRPTNQVEVVGASSTRFRLLATKIIIVGFALTLGLVGTRVALWPIVTWPMYHSRTPEVPPSLVTATHLRATDRNGEIHRLTPIDLVPGGRDEAAENLIGRVFGTSVFVTRPPAVIEGRRDPNPEATMEHLLFLVERALGGKEVAVIEVIDRTWRVDPYASPPLDHDRPVDEIVRGRLVEGELDAQGALE